MERIGIYPMILLNPFFLSLLDNFSYQLQFFPGMWKQYWALEDLRRTRDFVRIIMFVSKIRVFEFMFHPLFLLVLRWWCVGPQPPALLHPRRWQCQFNRRTEPMIDYLVVALMDDTSYDHNIYSIRLLLLLSEKEQQWRMMTATRTKKNQNKTNHQEPRTCHVFDVNFTIKKAQLVWIDLKLNDNLIVVRIDQQNPTLPP